MEGQLRHGIQVERGHRDDLAVDLPHGAEDPAVVARDAAQRRHAESVGAEVRKAAPAAPRVSPPGQPPRDAQIQHEQRDGDGEDTLVSATNRLRPPSGFDVHMLTTVGSADTPIGIQHTGHARDRHPMGVGLIRRHHLDRRRQRLRIGVGDPNPLRHRHTMPSRPARDWLPWRAAAGRRTDRGRPAPLRSPESSRTPRRRREPPRVQSPSLVAGPATPTPQASGQRAPPPTASCRRIT